MNIINEKVLVETPNVKFDVYEDEAKEYLSKIEQMSTSWIYGIIWPYGSGKSTMIEQMKKQSEKHIKRVQFDAWMFPERKELWDGFILNFWKNLNKKLFQKTLAAVEWKPELENEDNARFFYSNILKQFTWVDFFQLFLSTTPAKRVFQMQESFLSLLQADTNDTYIVVLEDVDRSWEEWMFFLETLSHFLKLPEFKSLGKKIVCLCLIANDSFYNEIDHYLKVLNHYDFRDPQKTAISFVDDFFLDEIKKESYSPFLLDIMVELILKKVNKDSNFREIKFILRQVNLEYKKKNKQIKYPVLFFILNLMSFQKQIIQPKNPLQGESFFRFTPQTSSHNVFYIIDDSNVVIKSLNNKSTSLINHIKVFVGQMLNYDNHEWFNGWTQFICWDKSINEDVTIWSTEHGNFRITIHPKYFINTQ